MLLSSWIHARCNFPQIFDVSVGYDSLLLANMALVKSSCLMIKVGLSLSSVWPWRKGLLWRFDHFAIVDLSKVEKGLWHCVSILLLFWIVSFLAGWGMKESCLTDEFLSNCWTPLTPVTVQGQTPWLGGTQFNPGSQACQPNGSWLLASLPHIAAIHQPTVIW